MLPSAFGDRDAVNPPPPPHIARAAALQTARVTIRPSIHGGDCVVLSGHRRPKLYCDALAELRAAQAAQAAYAAQVAARRRALAETSRPEGEAPPPPPPPPPPPQWAPSSPLAGVLLAAARATLSRERLQSLSIRHEREGQQALSTLSEGDAQLQAARRPTVTDRAASGGSLAAAVAAAAAAAATETVLLTRPWPREPLRAEAWTTLGASLSSAAGGLAPAAADGVGASDPRRDHAQRCAWGAKCRGV